MTPQSTHSRAARRQIALLAAACALGLPLAASQHVLTLTDATVNSTLAASSDALLLDVYAPWCVHCKSLEPEFAAAAAELAAAGLPVKLAKVDATSNEKTADWLAVKGYPALVLLRGGTTEAYRGERTRQALVLWVKKRVGPPAEQLQSLEALKAAQQASEVFLLGYFQQQQGPEWQAFEAAAREVSDWPVYSTASAEVAAALGLSAAPSFAIGTNFSALGGRFRAVPAAGHPAMQEQQPGEGLQQRLLAFVRAEQLPPYQPYTSVLNARLFAMERQVFLVGPLLQLQPGGAALAAVEAAHARFKGRIAFATAALGQDPADMLLDFFGLSRSLTDEIQVVGFQPEDRKYLLREPLTPASLTAFCEGVLDGSYPRLFKSQPPPAQPVQAHVAVVVGATFNATVLDPTRDVLLLVHASWSARSKHMAVVWKKLARHLRQQAGTLVAKFDGGENEHPCVPGTAFPAVWLFPAAASPDASAAAALKYSGEPTSKEILRFLRRHGRAKAGPPQEQQPPPPAPALDRAEL